MGYAFGTSGRRTLFAKMDSSLGKLNDNHWHKIHVIRTLWKLSVKIDDRSTTVVGEDEEKDSVDLTGDARSRLDIDLPMFVGSFWRFPSYRKGYVGCMKGFVSKLILYKVNIGRIPLAALLFVITYAILH